MSGIINQTTASNVKEGVVEEAGVATRSGSPAPGSGGGSR
jgi:hypothetical protein